MAHMSFHVTLGECKWVIAGPGRLAHVGPDSRRQTSRTTGVAGTGGECRGHVGKILCWDEIGFIWGLHPQAIAAQPLKLYSNLPKIRSHTVPWRLV